MFRKNYVKEKLESGICVIGTWCVIPSPAVTDIICSSGLDFIIIDAEHGPITFETAQEMAAVCESREVSPIMRVGGVNESDILRALDIGMHGIQIPNIKDKTEVEMVINYAKYPPIGNRGYSPFTRAGEYSLEKATTLTGVANKNTLVGVNIEGEEAINNIDDILKIQELDILFIGLYDISKALGIPGQVDHPLVQEKLEELTLKINKTGKYPGTIATNIESLNRYKDLDVKYILYLVDCNVLQSAYKIPIEKLKE